MRASVCAHRLGSAFQRRFSVISYDRCEAFSFLDLYALPRVGPLGLIRPGFSPRNPRSKSSSDSHSRRASTNVILERHLETIHLPRVGRAAEPNTRGVRIPISAAASMSSLATLSCHDRCGSTEATITKRTSQQFQGKVPQSRVSATGSRLQSGSRSCMFNWTSAASEKLWQLDREQQLGGAMPGRATAE